MTTILLIDDSRFQRTVNESTLKKAGYTVLTAVDGEEALRAVRSRHPDLILLDMLLPKLGGHQVLQILKQDPATAHIPVVVLTGLSAMNEEKLLKAGAAAYLEKARVVQEPQLLLLSVASILKSTTKATAAGAKAAATIYMRGDVGISWQNRLAKQEPVYKVEFLPDDQLGTGPRSCIVKGQADLEEHLRQFDIEPVYVDGWLKMLKDEDILIPYVGMPERMRHLYGL